MQGKFFWYDIMTTDTAAAATFYGDVVGWGTQDSGQTDKPYTLFTTEGQPVAGLMDLPEDVKASGGRSAWMSYVAVDDVGAAAKRLEELGGTMHREPCTIPGVIEFAVVSDPQGAVFLLAKPLVADAPPPPAEGTPGTVGWRELYAREGAEAFAFYATMFGWTKSRAMDMGPMGTYAIFAIGGAEAGGMMTKPPTVPAPYWGFYFNVPAIDLAVEKVKSGGGAVLQGPMEVPGGQWIVQATDPQGVYFALVAPHR